MLVWLVMQDNLCGSVFQSVFFGFKKSRLAIVVLDEATPEIISLFQQRACGSLPVRSKIRLDVAAKGIFSQIVASQELVGPRADRPVDFQRYGE